MPRIIRPLAVATALGLAATLLAPTAASADDYSVPYPTPANLEGELTGDGRIDWDDIELLSAAVGLAADDDGWADVAAADYDDDGRISVVDVATMSRKFLYDDGEFSLLETDVVEIQKSMTAGVLTSEDLVTSYLQRIADYDDRAVATNSSNTLNSMISLNPEALEQARALDAERLTTGPRGLLHGVPVVVKDNVNTVGMATTVGCTCLADNRTSSDGEVVERLREQGAVIIGKANLSEFAYAFASSWSHFGGTTYNAYDLRRPAGGSSGGSAAAISANLSVIGIGTDTGGSIRVPSSINGLVGIRPTVGLVSREGIFPLSLSRDTAGPMTRSVSDAAITLDAIAGTDPADPATADADARRPTTYLTALDDSALSGARIGYLQGFLFNSATAPGTRLMREALQTLRDEGATVVDVPAGAISTTGLSGTDRFELEANAYLTDYVRPGYTLADLARDSQGKSTLTSWLTGNVGTTPAAVAAGDTAWAQTRARIRSQIEAVMTTYDLDVLVYPSTRSVVGASEWSTAANNRLSPYSGYPAITVPMGYGDTTLGDVTSFGGTPMGLEFLGREWEDADIIGFAYDYEQASRERRPTTLFPAVD